MKYGVVIYTGVSSEDMIDEKTAPRGRKALMSFLAITGFCFFCLMSLSRVSVAREILAELPPDSPDRQFYQEFMMSIYCFPDSEDPTQLSMIRGLAFVWKCWLMSGARAFAQRRFIRHLEAILSIFLLLKIFSFHHEVDTSPYCVVVAKLHKKIAEVLHEFVKVKEG